MGSGDDKAEEGGEWRDSTTEYADVGAKSERSSLSGGGKARGSRHTELPPPHPRDMAPLPSLEGLQIVPDSLPKRDVFINQVHTPLVKCEVQCLERGATSTGDGFLNWRDDSLLAPERVFGSSVFHTVALADTR